MLDTLRLKNQELLGFSRVLCQALQWETGGAFIVMLLVFALFEQSQQHDDKR